MHRSNRLGLALLAGVATVVIGGTVFAMWPARMMPPVAALPAPHDEPQHGGGAGTLYQRLGGYDALAAVTDDFIGRLISDPKLGRFWVGHSTNSRQRIRQLIVDQLCAVTGGPCVYVGRDMKTSHAGLGITEEDWTKSVEALVATLDKFKVPPKEKDEVLALLTTLKADIVEK